MYIGMSVREQVWPLYWFHFALNMSRLLLWNVYWARYGTPKGKPCWAGVARYGREVGGSGDMGRKGRVGDKGYALLTSI